MATSNLSTTQQAASQIGCHVIYLRLLCKRHQIGQIYGKTRLLTDSDIDRLKELMPGAGKKWTGKNNPNYKGGQNDN
tara:strand:+ start:321 stop:551 length:231 start_codon:yes stop_codon:yes gene_type:complete